LLPGRRYKPAGRLALRPLKGWGRIWPFDAYIYETVRFLGAEQKMKRLRTLAGIGLGLLVVVGSGWYFSQHQSSAPARQGRFGAGGPIPVGTAQAAKSDIPIVIKALGTVTPLATVTVKTQITGQLVQVAFTEGQSVKKGDLLAVVDPRPYDVALQQAQ